MHVESSELREVMFVQPDVHGDSRGFFMEAFNRSTLAAAGIALDVLQHNHSRSQKGVVRGLHFQWHEPLSKLIRVVRGKAFFVAVDIRKDSPTIARWVGRELSDESKTLIWIPFGFATGFCALGDDTEVEYYYSALYDPAGESVIQWDDKTIDIAWPVARPLLSTRDAAAPSLQEWLKRPESDLVTMSDQAGKKA